MKRVFILKGLDCPNCSAKIEKEVGALPGVESSVVNIGITDFELPGQDFLLHTGHHLFHDLYAAHKLFRTGNVGFADIVPLCDLPTNACF